MDNLWELAEEYFERGNFCWGEARSRGKPFGNTLCGKVRPWGQVLFGNEPGSTSHAWMNCPKCKELFRG